MSKKAFNPYAHPYKLIQENRRPKYDGDFSFQSFRGKETAAADFNKANLAMCDFAGCDLRFASFAKADCSYANFGNADLRCATFKDASLEGAFLGGAWLDMTNFSNVHGLLTNREWMDKHLEKEAHGYIVYRGFSKALFASHWDTPRSGAVLEQFPNPDRTALDGCGVSFGTQSLVMRMFQDAPPVWRCLIRMDDLPDVIIPFNTDGRGRCRRLVLLHTI